MTSAGEQERLRCSSRPRRCEPLVLGQQWRFSTDKPNSLPLIAWESQLEPTTPLVEWSAPSNSSTCRFYCATKPAKARLLIDGLLDVKIDFSIRANAQLELNGQPIANIEKGTYLDHYTFEADVSGLLKDGENVLSVRTQGSAFDALGVVHPQILLGDFSLQKNDAGEWAVAAPVTSLSGDWSTQGYPFYSG